MVMMFLLLFALAIDFVVPETKEKPIPEKFEDFDKMINLKVKWLN